MRIKLAIAATVLILTACSTTPRPAEIAEAPVPEVRVGLASWAFNYKTLEDLVQASDVIVVGKIKGDGAIVRGPSVMATEYELDVKKVLKDHKQRDKLSSLILRQTGGITRERIFEIHDDPLFKKNQQVVLFLKEFEAGKVVVVGGPNGRFHIEHGRIVPVDKTSIAIEPNMAEQKFVDDIESIVKTGKKKLTQ